MAKEYTSVEVKLKNVRGSFLHIFNPHAFKQGDKENFSADLIIEKSDKENVARLRTALEEILKKRNGGTRLSAKNTCVKDGSVATNKDGDLLEGYGADKLFVRTKNLPDDRPAVWSKTNKPVTANDADAKNFYGGAYFDAVITMYWLENSYGKFVNANLKAIRFSQDGEPFSGRKANTEYSPEELFGDSGAAEVDDGFDL